MKKIIIILSILLSVKANAQTISVDGNTGNCIAPIQSLYFQFLNDSATCRIMTAFNFNQSATIVSNHWSLQYEIVHDSTNVEWKTISDGNFPTALSGTIIMDYAKIAIFDKVRDSVGLHNIIYK